MSVTRCLLFRRQPADLIPDLSTLHDLLIQRWVSLWGGTTGVTIEPHSLVPLGVADRLLFRFIRDHAPSRDQCRRPRDSVLERRRQCQRSRMDLRFHGCHLLLQLLGCRK